MSHSRNGIFPFVPMGNNIYSYKPNTPSYVRLTLPAQPTTIEHLQKLLLAVKQGTLHLDCYNDAEPEHDEAFFTNVNIEEAQSNLTKAQKQLTHEESYYAKRVELTKESVKEGLVENQEAEYIYKKLNERLQKAMLTVKECIAVLKRLKHATKLFNQFHRPVYPSDKEIHAFISDLENEISIRTAASKTLADPKFKAEDSVVYGEDAESEDELCQTVAEYSPTATTANPTPTSQYMDSPSPSMNSRIL
jgi:hypothetical protein